MRILALESATPVAAAALVVDGEVIDETVATRDRRHTETLLPEAASMLARAACPLASLDLIVVDLGPGLFTGLRVGVATARSLSVAGGVPVVGVTSLEILAADPATDAQPVVIAVIDARRGEVFAQRFEGPVEHRRAQGSPRVLVPDHLAELVRGLSSPPAFIGDGAQRYREEIARISDGPIVEHEGAPRPSVAARLVERHPRSPGPATALVPLYLRDPDAVANFTVASGLSGR